MLGEKHLTCSVRNIKHARWETLNMLGEKHLTCSVRNIEDETVKHAWLEWNTKNILKWYFSLFAKSQLDFGHCFCTKPWWNLSTVIVKFVHNWSWPTLNERLFWIFFQLANFEYQTQTEVTIFFYIVKLCTLLNRYTPSRIGTKVTSLFHKENMKSMQETMKKFNFIQCVERQYQQILDAKNLWRVNGLSYLSRTPRTLSVEQKCSCSTLDLLMVMWNKVGSHDKQSCST